MEEILTPQENAEIEWAQKHRVPTFKYFPELGVIATNSDRLQNYVQDLLINRTLPKVWQTAMDKKSHYTPQVIYCTPIQAYLLEINRGIKRL